MGASMVCGRADPFLATLISVVRFAFRTFPLGCTAIALTQVVQGLLPLASAWITKLLFDLLAVVIQQGSAGDLLTPLWPLLALQAGVLVLGQLLGPVDSYLNNELGRQLVLRVQSDIYGKLNSLQGLQPFESPHFYNNIQMAVNGAQFGPRNAVTQLCALIRSLVTVASFAGVLLTLSPFLALCIAAAAAPELYTYLKFGAQRFSLSFVNTPKERRAAYYGNVLAGAAFAKELRLFQLGDFFLQAFRRTTADVLNSKRQQEQREFRWRALLSVISAAVTTGAFVAVFVRAFGRHISIGDVTLFVNAARSVQGALSSAVLSSASLQESTLFFSRYLELLSIKEPLAACDRPQSMPQLRHGIELRHVSFRYSEQHPWILRDVSLRISAGHCVALVGLNGAGKTTLVKLLTRLYDPTEGQILWDGIDIRNFDPRAYRRAIGVIFQDFARYELSAYDNIAVGDIDARADEERVRATAKAARIHGSIEKLHQGYQTLLSRWLAEDGIGAEFSGGEWQRLALARLLMRRSELLLLDEPTAALDAEAEAELYGHFVDLMARRTSVLISHRLSAAQLADHVAVLEDGRIIEWGTPQDLMKRGGSFARLYALQSERYQSAARPSRQHDTDHVLQRK